MPHFQFVVLICAGSLTIMAIAFKFIGEFMKKTDSGKIIKEACVEKFIDIRSCLKEFESGAKERSNRILVMETRFAEILSRITRLETVMDKNAEMTSLIYAYMSKRKGNGVKQD
jgi:hypothetical protein